MLEGVLRSVNNLLERFHQSFFFYLRPAPGRLISIGLYMPPLGLLLAAPLISALALWARMTEEEAADQSPPVPTTPTGRQRSFSVEKARREAAASDRSLLGALPYLAISHILGFLCLFMPKLVRWFDHGAVGWERGGGGVLLNGIAAVFLVAGSVPASLGGRRDGEWRASGSMLRCLTLLHLALVLATTALLNFSLGFGLAVLYVPVFLCAAPRRSRLAAGLTRAVVLLANPLLLYLLASLHESGWSVGSWDWGRSGLHSLLSDYAVHRSWLLPFASLGLVPLWTQAWILANDAPAH